MSIPILVTLDENYIPQLNVLLVSLYINHPGQSFDIYLVHSRISKEKIAKIDLNCRKLGFVLFSVRTNELLFENAPITKRYPKEMYYRLLAAQILPQELDKIIYIDPDTLVINSILPLWKKNINDYLFAAAAHTGKTELIHAVVEGVFYHLRWMLECQDKKISTSDPIRFVGGMARSKVICQMLSDILGRKLETVESPQNVGSVGAAMVAAVGLGLVESLEKVKDFVPADALYIPDMKKHMQYEKYYQVFKKLYKTNRNIYKELASEK